MISERNEEMDPKEAIKHIDDIINNPETCEECRQEHLQLREWLERLETLETENAILKRKEVAKVPENMFIERDLSAGYIVKRNIRGFCPTCSSGLLLYNGVHRYCPFCSQKLDWPSDKE